MELKCQFDLIDLADLGLDMRFSGRKMATKNNGDRNVNRISRFAVSSSTPVRFLRRGRRTDKGKCKGAVLAGRWW
jgi:hypothetical protein